MITQRCLFKFEEEVGGTFIIIRCLFFFLKKALHHAEIEVFLSHVSCEKQLLKVLQGTISNSSSVQLQITLFGCILFLRVYPIP